MLLQTLVHYFLHFGAVGLIAYLYDRQNWWKAWLVLIATMAIDVDHLLANPIFDPRRCSIGYHPLHSLPAIIVYLLGVLFLRNWWWRLVAIGLLFHILTDTIDCFWMFSACRECYEGWRLIPFQE